VLVGGPASPAGRRTRLLVGPLALLVVAVLTWFGAPPVRPGVPSADAVVDGPGAQLLRVAVSVTDPQSRASVWRTCAGRSCARSWLVVAVTVDGFEHRTLAGPWRADGARVTAAPGGRFLVHVDGVPAFLLDVSGDRRALGLPGGPRPLRSGELVVGGLAVDPATGTTHGLPLPRGTTALTATEDGRLVAVAAGALLGSSDGGASWRRTPLPVDGATTLPLASARTDTVAALRGDQGVTWLPVSGAVRRVAGRVHVDEVPRPPQARPFVDDALVLPDGSLLVDVVAWSTDRNGDHVGAVGAFVTDQGRWRTWHPMQVPRYELPRDVARAMAARPLRLVGAAVGAGEAIVLLASGTTVAAVDTAHWLWVPVRVR